MSTSTLVVLTVVEIGLLIAGLAFYLAWVGVLLAKIATNLEDCNESVKKIAKDAEVIIPGVEHINRSGGVVAGALPLLYGFAEKIITGVTPTPPAPERRSGSRRSRLHEMVGYSPSRH
ncbi:MAG: hypothetical protein ACRDQ5_15170 [Sciscionella sp.]